jgi:hypothetical protein
VTDVPRDPGPPREITLVTEAICRQCGEIAEVRHRHRAEPVRLRYSESSRCAGCGAAWESDADRPPDPVRVLMIAQHGAWIASLVELGPRRAKVVQYLASVGHRSAADVEALVAQLPMRIAEGTSVEVLLAVETLEVLGAQVVLTRAPERHA